MDWELRTLLLLSSGRNWWVGWMPFVLLAGHLASNSWPALHSSKIVNKKSNRHSKAILEQRCLYNMCPSCFILLHLSSAWAQWGIYGDRLVCQADLKKLRQLTEKISKQMYLDQLVAECVNGWGVAWSANSIVAFGAWGSSILFFGDMEVIADSKWSGCNMKFEYWWIWSWNYINSWASSYFYSTLHYWTSANCGPESSNLRI